MKSTILFLSIFLLTILFSKSYAQTVNWQFATNTEGWHFVNCTSAVADDKLNLTIQSGDPYIVYDFKDGVTLPSGDYKYVKIRLKNGSSDSAAQFYWFSAATPADITFVLKPNSDDFTDYYIDLSNNPNWTGNIRKIRFDLPKYGSDKYKSSEVGKVISVDDIQFLKNLPKKAKVSNL